jgi:hypothetical protein
VRDPSFDKLRTRKACEALRQPRSG